MATAHHLDPSLLREYDLRGIVGNTLHEANALALGHAFGTVLRRAGTAKVCLGRDVASARWCSPLPPPAAFTP